MNTNSEDQRLELNNSRKIMRSKKDIYLNNNFQENHTITNGLNQEYEYCEVQTRKDQSNDALKDRKNGKQSKEVYCKIVLQNNGCFKCILKDDHQNQNNAGLYYTIFQYVFMVYLQVLYSVIYSSVLFCYLHIF